jgi:hypothetical protein
LDDSLAADGRAAIKFHSNPVVVEQDWKDNVRLVGFEHKYYWSQRVIQDRWYT